jgi:hypothetical protein
MTHFVIEMNASKELSMKRIVMISFIVLMGGILSLRGAFEDLKTGTRPAALGGAFTALSNDHNASFWNPAGLSELDSPEIFSSYRRLFGIVHNFTFVSCIDTRYGGFGITVRETSVKGDYTDISGGVVDENTTLEAERALLVSHGFHLMPEVSFGYNLVGYQLQNVRFGDSFAVGADIGMLMEVYRRWKIGFFFRNLNSPTIGDAFSYALPEEISIGVAYVPIEQVVTLLDFEKQFGYEINVKMGTEIVIIDELLTLRGGVQSEPVDFSLGFGTGFRNLRLNYAFRTHSELPLTHLVEAGWKF